MDGIHINVRREGVKGHLSLVLRNVGIPACYREAFKRFSEPKPKREGKAGAFLCRRQECLRYFPYTRLGHGKLGAALVIFEHKRHFQDFYAFAPGIQMVM